MSDSVLVTALEQLHARMDAVAGPDGNPPPELSPLVLSGLNLDLDEARQRMHDLAHAIEVTAALSGEPLCQVMTAALVQMMAVGVLHEREWAARDRVTSE